MLVKWAIEGRRKTAESRTSLGLDDRRNVVSTSAPNSVEGLGSQDMSRMGDLTVEPETTAQALTAQLDRLHYQSDNAVARSTEDEGDRAMRRIHAEERDTKLRDEKLLSLVGSQLIRHNSAQGRESEPSMPLTEENIEKLVHEQDGDTAHVRNTGSPGVDSNMANQPHSRSNSKQLRPPLSDRRLHESEQTVTAQRSLR